MHPPHKQARVVKGVLISAVVALVVALTSASALASPVPATWVKPGLATLSGTLTVKLNGSSAKTCTIASAGGEAANGKEGVLIVSANPNHIPGVVAFTCAGGSSQLWMNMISFASYDSGYLLTTKSESGLPSPYGTWSQIAVPMPFTNAAGETPSHVTLSETKLGSSAMGTITGSGTLNIKGSGGSALTLTH